MSPAAEAAEQARDAGSKRVLITGGAGFVGCHVTDVLSRTTTHRILAVDAVETPRATELAGHPRVDFRQLDLRDAAALEDAMTGTDTIVHLAAVRTKAAQTRTKDAHDINVGSVFDVLTLATRLGVGRVVFGSTNTVYGPYADPDAPPFREDAPWVCSGINLYAATKLAGEAYLEAFASAGGPDYLALRIGPIYGPRVSPGSNASLALDIVQAIDSGHPPEVAWTRDSIHSFVHVDDVAQAIAASIESSATRMAINVVGQPVSTEQFCRRLVELYGHDPEGLVYTGERARYQRVSQDRMLEVLGFAPRTSMDTGLQSFIDWHRTQTGMTE